MFLQAGGSERQGLPTGTMECLVKRGEPLR